MVSEREVADLRAAVTRLQAESTAELLKHRAKIADAQKIIDLRNREIAELRAAMREALDDGCDCEICSTLDAALAGKGVK